MSVEFYEDATKFDYLIGFEGSIVPVNIGRCINDEPIGTTAEVHLGRCETALVHPPGGRAHHHARRRRDAVQTRCSIYRGRHFTDGEVELKPTDALPLHFAVESHHFEFDTT